jgi:hypothetical protein
MAPAAPTSPLKRITRARAAAKKDDDIKMPASKKSAPKPAARKRGAPVEEAPVSNDIPEDNKTLRKSARRVPTAAPARRIRITPLAGGDAEQSQQDEPDEQLIAKEPKATRAKKATATDPQGEDKNETTSDVSFKPKAKVAVNEKITSEIAPRKTRGRPKKAEVAKDEAVPEAEAPRKQTRARAASGSTNTKALAVAPTKATIAKKKVTFQDLPESDKENLPVPQTKRTAKGKSRTTTAGIRAKPVRRPAATSKAKTKQGGKEQPTAAAIAPGVLTPKKITQVAKSSSPEDSGEDELNGAKTPIRDLSQSPSRKVNIPRGASPVKKLDFGNAMLATSQAKSQSS